jgi:DNA-binding IclR family transcriptional regulator
MDHAFQSKNKAGYWGASIRYVMVVRLYEDAQEVEDIVEEKKLVPAIQKALEILSLLANNGEKKMSVSEIATKLSYSKGTTHSILNTLVYYRVVDKGLLDGKYTLGDGILQLAESFNRRQEDISTFYEVAENIHKSCKENINYSILKGMYNYVLAVIPSADYTLKVDMPVGSIIPVIASSAGKVLISNFDKKTLIHIFEEQYSQYTPNTISSCDDFIKEIEKVKHDGYALNRGEYEEGVCSVAAPICNNRGRIVAAINIVIPQSRFSPEMEKRLINLVTHSAVVISKSISTS